VEEELIQRRQRPPAALAESREVSPVELEDLDGTIVRAPAQRNARRFVDRFAFRQLEAPEQVVVQRETEILRARIRAGGGGNRSLRLVKAARRARPPSRRRDSFPVADGRRHPCGRRGAAGREAGDRDQDLMKLALHVTRLAFPAVAQEPRELSHCLSRTL